MENERIENKTEENVLVLDKRNLIKIIIIAVTVVSIILAVILGYGIAKGKYEQAMSELEEENTKLSNQMLTTTTVTKEVSIQVINSEIQEIGELATMEYMYTDAGKFEDPAKLFDKDVPFSFTTTSFVAKWDGVIKAGVDIEQVKAEVDESNKEIIIHMPPAKILSHEVDKTSFAVLDQKEGLFNSLKVEDVVNFDVSTQNEMEKRALENGILSKAEENAKRIIEGLVNNEAVKELGYTITFEMIAE